MKLYIIGDLSDKENINAFCKQFDEAAIEPIPLFPATDFMAKGTAVSSQLVVLWISSKTGDAIFNIANERNEKNLTSINYFADPVALSDSQKNAIGRNHSVFASLYPDRGVNDILSLIDFDSLTSSSKSITKTDEASLGINVKSKGNNPVENQNTLSVRDVVGSKNCDGLNNSIPNSGENIPSSEDSQQNGSRILWMPIIWYIISIVYYVCLDQGIIMGWTNQTMWFLFITAVWFLLTYKIIRSTISAIKINKWCYAYLPFSLIMVYFDLFYGFRFITVFFDYL